MFHRYDSRAYRQNDEAFAERKHEIHGGYDMIEAASAAYDVGGVLLERPFKVRRLGHVGFNCLHIEESLPFYHDLLGFAISDRVDFSPRAANPRDLDGLGDPSGYFMRYGSDHHSFVLFNKRVRDAIDRTGNPHPEVLVNQISWQVGSLEEVSRGDDWLRTRGVEVQRAGRDWPGSNWHSYFYDPDGHVNELFYGMEQIGWQGKSKPETMEPDIRLRAKPALPRASELDEIQNALAKGIDLSSGQGVSDTTPRIYDVEGVMLARPFRVTRIGPLSLFVNDVEQAAQTYTHQLGLQITEEITWQGFRCVFLRAGTEHHSLVLCPIALRAKLGFRSDSTTMTIGMQVATYRQLRAARAFFEERGARMIELPPELHPGIDYAFHLRDPEGHCVQLYFGMEQLGWQGVPRPASQRPRIAAGAWPEAIDGAASLFDGEPFMGPLG